MAKVYSYDPQDITLQIAGIFINDGFPESEKINLEKNEDNVIPLVAVNGSVYYSENADNTHTLRVPQADRSPYLEFFRKLARNKTEFVISIVDMNDNGRNFTGSGCRVLRAPGMQALKEVGEQEVEIFIPSIR